MPVHAAPMSRSPLIPEPSTEEVGTALLEAMAATERAIVLMARVQGCTCNPTVSFKQGSWPLEWRVSHALCPMAGRDWAQHPEIPESWRPH